MDLALQRAAVRTSSARTSSIDGGSLVSGPAVPFATVAVHADPEAAAADWAALEASCPCTIYQTRRWVLPWLATMGALSGVAPMIVVAHDAEGCPVALLPLGLRRMGPLRIAVWLGGKDCNLALPLLRPDAGWTPEACAALLRQAASVAPARPHLFLLRNQPVVLDRWTNPLALLFSRRSPSDAYGTALDGDAEAFFKAKLSSDSRKKIRKKDAKLRTFGTVRHEIAATPETIAAALDALVAMKLARFEAQGIASLFATPEMRAFLEQSAASGAMELHTLTAGERIVAVYGGGAHAGRWSGMVNAFDADPDIARASPGDLLLMRIVAKAAADGTTSFDLGIGAARYKAALCDQPIELRDAIVTTGLVGSVARIVAIAGLSAKRRIKDDPRLLAAAQRLARGLSR